MGVVVRAILLGAHVAKRAWTKGNHKERLDVDVEPEGKREGVSLGLSEITTGTVFICGFRSAAARLRPA